MQYFGKRKKSFLLKRGLLGRIFFPIGILFLLVALIMQIVPLNFQTLETPINEMPYSELTQPARAMSEHMFRFIFLSVFGLPGAIFTIIGGLILLSVWNYKKRTRELKANGTRVIADVTGRISTNMVVNERIVQRLTCAYTNSRGETFIFKSGRLRMDPKPYIKDDKVIVYFDRENPRRNFVDIDESVGLNTTVFEV